jgi:prophage DNA circulation protein
MTRAAQLEEAVKISTLLSTWLLQAVPGPNVGRLTYTLRRLVGDLVVNTPEYIKNNVYSLNLWLCFNTMRQAGATYNAMDVIRTNLLELDPQGVIGIAQQVLAMQFTLVQQARLNAGTDFFSRDDVDTMMQRVADAFSPVIEYLSGTGMTGPYQAFISLYAATNNDLTSRSRPLPRMIVYHQNIPIPTLTLANFLYPSSTDGLAAKSVARRSNELVMENHIIHPAFPLPDGRCLSDLG